MEILQAEAKSDFKEFIRIPWKIYEGNPYWVPPLIKEQEKVLSSLNPFFKHAEMALFVAQDNSTLLGRIAAIVDGAYQEYHREKAGTFGFFESVDDYGVAGALLDRAAEWLRARGAEVVRGPFNPSTNEECGLLVEGFEKDPSIMMPYTHSYYPQLLERYGFQKEKDLLAYEVILNKDIPSEWSALAQRAQEKGAVLRPVNLNNFRKEIETIRDIYNSAWSKNWGFVPMTYEEMLWMGERLKPLVTPELILLAEMDGVPVGFIMALPNFNRVLKKLNGSIGPLGAVKMLWGTKKIKDLRFITFGVKESYRRNRYISLLHIEIIKNARAKGYELAEISWVLEDNLIPHNGIIKHLGGSISKRYRIYGMNL